MSTTFKLSTVKISTKVLHLTFSDKPPQGLGECKHKLGQVRLISNVYIHCCAYNLDADIFDGR
jgi:hypothetical protein